MSNFKVLATLVIALAFLGTSSASGTCPPKLTTGQKERPYMPTMYSATYEASKSGDFTIILNEEYDGVKERYSITQHLQGTTEVIYETGGSTPQLFNMTDEGVCREMQRSDLLDMPLFNSLRRTTKLLADKNIYLKFLVDLPKDYLIGYKGVVKDADLNMTVEDWLFCINGTMINIYWTEIGAVIEDDKGKQFPIKISVTYQKPKLTESIYIFKYIRNKVNETAIEPPAYVNCPGRYNNRSLDMSSFIGPDMYFTTEVINPETKQIFTTEHYYALDEKLAVFITPDPDPKHPHQVVYKTNFVFDFDLGYFFKVKQQIRTCEAHSIDDYAGRFGDIFQIYKGMFADLSSMFTKGTKYYFANKAFQRGLSTDVYKGYRQNYPLGIANVDSVINWYIIEKDQYGSSVPVAVEYYLLKNNSPTSAVTGKALFNLFDWTKKNLFDIVYTQSSDFNTYYCMTSGNTRRVKFSLTFPTLKQGEYVRQDMLYRQLRVKIGELAKISKLRINYLHASTMKPGIQTIAFTFFRPFKNVGASNVTITDAFVNLQSGINKGLLSVNVLSYLKMNVTYTAVKDSLLYQSSNEEPNPVDENTLLKIFPLGRNEDGHY